jgi:hypothetical protein
MFPRGSLLRREGRIGWPPFTTPSSTAAFCTFSYYNAPAARSVLLAQFSWFCCCVAGLYGGDKFFNAEPIPVRWFTAASLCGTMPFFAAAVQYTEFFSLCLYLLLTRAQDVPLRGLGGRIPATFSVCSGLRCVLPGGTLDFA